MVDGAGPILRQGAGSELSDSRHFSNTPFFSRALLASAVGGLSGDQLRELFGRHRSRDAESLAHVAAGVGQPALGGLVFDAFGGDGGAQFVGQADDRGDDGLVGARVERSEEHTSELQSLMRISYAVF